MGEDGRPLPFPRAVLSGRSTGVPGAIAMLSLAQSEHGQLPWKDLFGEAETLADQGFVISPRLGGMIAGGAFQAKAPDIVAYFTKPDGTRYATGDRLKNPAYAATLRKIAAEGPKALLEGAIAEHIVARTHEGALPGALTLADLAAYKPRSGQAVCRPYRVYLVCVPPLPSGGPALLEGLGILANTDIGAHPNDAQGWYLFVEASRLMYADRDRYMGDPAFVDVPVEGLLDPGYLAARARLVGPMAAAGAPAPGTPKGAGVRAPDATREPGGTSHIVIVDAKGDVVSMTTTVESIFGSGRMVDGFILNNQLTDFSFSPVERDGAPAANAVAGGKRPRSSMAPTVILDRQGRFVAAFGSPGGSSILAYNLKTAVGVMDWGLPLQAAIDLPNVIARGTNFGAEVGKMAPATLSGLAARGVTLTPGQGEESGLHGVQRLPDGTLRGGADPRREGQARGF
jgi:gamma-glutamyltranspeptidase/glutathione hydrolase